MSVQSDDPTLSQSDGQPDGAAPMAADAQPASGDEQLDALRGELADMEQKADEYLRLAQRAQADFINFKRRVEEERAAQAANAGISVLQRLFPVLDDFQRALANASDAERASGWGQGISLVERNLWGVLAAEGVEPIGAEGAEFDPRLHEALGAIPTQEVPEGHVAQVVRQGYRKGDRVLRPTQVVIARRAD